MRISAWVLIGSVVGIVLMVSTKEHRHAILGPITSHHRLSDGSQVALPFHVRESRQLLLAGEADLQVVTKFLKKVNLHPFVVSQDTAAVLMGAIDYEECVVGHYNEFFSAAIAFDSPQSSLVVQLGTVVLRSLPWLAWIADALHWPVVHLVVMQMVVDQKLTYLAGREIWGYPKEIADITLSPSAQKDGGEEFVARFSAIPVVGSLFEQGSLFIDRGIGTCHVKFPPSKEGQEDKSAVLMDASPSKWWSPSLWSSLEGITVTPTQLKSTKGRTAARGWYRIRLFAANADTFLVWPDAPLGKELHEVQFQPRIWFDYWRISAVLEGPMA